ncbi:MAG: hypothetical protein QXL94_01050 [Candidatus Parvarchaeum sp.]
MNSDADRIEARLDRLEDNLRSDISHLRDMLQAQADIREKQNSHIHSEIGVLKGQIKIIVVVFGSLIAAITTAIVAHIL